MRILIATPLLPTQPGGPGQFGYQLSLELIAMGHTVVTVDFTRVKRFPMGIRHILLSIILLKSMRHVDGVLSLDTVSMALPAVCVARVYGVRSVVRVGGDFVWEQYVERTKQKVKLSEFYTAHYPLSCKESILIWIQRHIVFRFADAVVFSTAWQRDIWSKPYQIPLSKVHIIENAYAPIGYQKRAHHTSKHVLWVGRERILKNVDVLDHAILEVQKKYPETELKKYSNISHDEVIEALRTCRMLVIPSVSEVSPNLVFEALAFSIPVLLTDDCGLYHLLRESVVWINATDVTDIAGKICRLMDDEKYTEMVTRIQQYPHNRTYTDVAHAFLTVIQSS